VRAFGDPRHWAVPARQWHHDEIGVEAFRFQRDLIGAFAEDHGRLDRHTVEMERRQ
jgi:hypothetical protein